MEAKKVEDTKEKNVKTPETSCQGSVVNESENEKIQRSAAVPDCDCDGSTKQIYDVTWAV